MTSRSKEHRRAWFSAVEYRPNPADSKTDVIDLGFLLEFTTPKFWVVGVVVRAGLTDEQLAGVDDLTRKVLEHRSDVLAREVDRVLPLATRPGEALSLLASANPWSFNVARPNEVELPATTAKQNTVQEALEEYVYSFYVKWMKTMVAHEGAHVEQARQSASYTLSLHDALPIYRKSVV